jgi:sugar phosphate isomerase/epimerase
LNRHRDPAVGQRFRAAVQRLAAGAKRCGLVLAVETLPYKPEVDERYADSAEVAAFVRGLDDPHVGICIDLNHSNLHERLEDAAGNCRGQIVNIHVSDNRGVREEHLVPGEGVIDFVAALRALRAAGYAGPLNIECHLPRPPDVATLTTLRLNAEKLARVVGEP